MIKRHKFDVILIDFWLVKMTADVLVSWIFNIKRHPGERVPLLAVCSNPDLLQMAKEKMLTYGKLVQYVKKPLTPAKLQNLVAAVEMVFPRYYRLCSGMSKMSQDFLS